MHASLFGTDGIRSNVGSWPFEQEDLTQLAHAVGIWISANYGTNARILIAHDTRMSAYWIKAQLSSLLLLHSCSVFDAQVISTPAACFLMHYTNDYDCAIMITASHNAYTDNGIKLIKQGGIKLTAEEEQEITDLFYTTDSTQHFPNYEQLGTYTHLHQPLKPYLTYLERFIPENILQGKTIVLDCAYGATSKYAYEIFTATGATIVALNTIPDGKNINRACGALHPEQLQKAIVEHDADAGFAFDGDGDRILAVNAHGEIKDGDDILYLLMQHPLYTSARIIVGTVMTNQGLELYAHNNQKTIIRTAVGDKYICHELSKNNLLLGGEPSGHIIMCDYLGISDGIALALRICHTLMLTDNWPMRTFQKVPHIMINLAIKEKMPLDHEPLKTLIAQTEQQLPYGRMLIRYSGTEPLLRILIEDLDLQHAHYVGTTLSKQLEKILT